MSNSSPPRPFLSNDSSSSRSFWQNLLSIGYQPEQSEFPNRFDDLDWFSNLPDFNLDSSTAPGTNERGSFVDGNLGLSEHPTGNRSQHSGLEQLKDVEEPKEKNYVEDSENALPKLGMDFSTEEEAKKFYDDYARKIGFEVRIGDKWILKDGSIKRYFCCSRHKSLGKRRRGKTPGDCVACLQITFEKEKWVVSLLNLEHTHELSPSLLYTEQADRATFIVESNISTESWKRPNEVPFDKSKSMKHIGSLLGSQKAEEQKVNTPMDHSVDSPIETIEEADAFFADIGQVTSWVSSQATSSKKPNFSEDLVHPGSKPDVMNIVETLIHSNVLSEAQNSFMVELCSNFLNSLSLKKEMSEVQKSTDSRTGLTDYLKQEHLKYKTLRTQAEMKEMEILWLRAHLKEMMASKERLLCEVVELAREVKEKKDLWSDPTQKF